MAGSAVTFESPSVKDCLLGPPSSMAGSDINVTGTGLSGLNEGFDSTLSA